MSVRTYRIIRKEFAKSPTWNMWHEQGIEDYLSKNFQDYNDMRNQDGNGEIEVSVAALERLCKAIDAGKVKGVMDDEPVSKETAKAIRKDIAWAKKRGNDYIAYECF